MLCWALGGIVDCDHRLGFTNGDPHRHDRHASDRLVLQTTTSLANVCCSNADFDCGHWRAIIDPADLAIRAGQHTTSTVLDSVRHKWVKETGSRSAPSSANSSGARIGPLKLPGNRSPNVCKLSDDLAKLIERRHYQLAQNQLISQLDYPGSMLTQYADSTMVYLLKNFEPKYRKPWILEKKFRDDGRMALWSSSNSLVSFTSQSVLTACSNSLEHCPHSELGWSSESVQLNIELTSNNRIPE